MIRQDIRRRPGLSSAVWVPTIFVAILGSRPLSMWLSGFVDATGNLSDGTPIDRNFYLVAILAGFYILSKRKFRWSPFISSNKALFLFYGYLLLSVLWADSPFSSFKRLFKDFGGIVLSLVILTEARPLDAIKAVFVRCAYVFFPLSYCFIRYIPNLGRVYSRGGDMEATGVTCQKNSLGALIVICGLPVVWNLLESCRDRVAKKNRRVFYGELLIGIIGLYLLYLSSSKSSLVCFVVGGIILAFPFVPGFKEKAHNLALYMPLAAAAWFLLDATIGIKESALEGLGRDATFTGRTLVWDFLLKEKTDPIFGTGYYSIWATPSFRDRMPDWMSNSAHSGYLEAYIDGGYIEIVLLAVLLIVVLRKIHKSLARGESGSTLRLAFFMSAVLANLSESYFARLSLVWFGFVLTTCWETPDYRAAFGSVLTPVDPVLTQRRADVVHA